MATSITITGIAEAKSFVTDLPANVAKQTILQMSQIAFTSMQDGAGRHRKTGNLFASLYNRQIPDGRQVGHDEQRAPYAPFVVFGTKPHKIYPKDKKALRWVTGNGFVFAKFVNHPGYRGDNYLETAAADAVREMPKIVDTIIKGN